MKSGGIEALRSDLHRIDETLHAFDAPIVDDRPGLRWMRDVLRTRRDHVSRSLRDAEMTALAVSVEAPASTRWTVEAVAQLASALQGAVDATARRLWDEDGASELVVRSVSSDGGALRIVLERPDGPLEALRVDGDGRPRIDAAVEAFVEALGQARDDQPQHAEELAGLAEFVVAQGVVATVEARCIDQSPRTAVVDQAAAERMRR